MMSNSLALSSQYGFCSLYSAECLPSGVREISTASGLICARGTLMTPAYTELVLQGSWKRAWMSSDFTVGTPFVFLVTLTALSLSLS